MKGESLLETLTEEQASNIIASVGRGDLSDDPRVLELRRGFIEDEVKLATLMAHDPTPIRTMGIAVVNFAGVKRGQ